MRDLAEIVAPPELTDGRIRLRALRPDDKPAVVAGLNDEQAGRFLWRPPFPYSESDFDEFYAASQQFWAAERDAHWIVADAGDDAVLASISIDITELREAGEIGYWCGPWARRRGIMTTAVRMVRDWAFDEIGLERLEIMAHVDNIASQRVALAAGFRREGVLRGYLTARGRRTDNVLFGMVPGDPRPAAGERQPGLGWPRLTDGRVIVRAFEPGDAPAVQAACDDADIAHWIHLVPAPYTMADAERFVAESRGALAAGKRARLAIVNAHTGELLGSISCDLARDRQGAEIGYWVRHEARRHGFAAAAARLVIDWAFRDLGLERLEILTYPGNAASQSLAAKLGFTREGVLRGFLAVEPGKSRDGRYVTAGDAANATAGAPVGATAGATAGVPAGAAPPARDDQVQFSLLRADWRA